MAKRTSKPKTGRPRGFDTEADIQAYYAALAAADCGDLKLLQDRIKAALQ